MKKKNLIPTMAATIVAAIGLLLIANKRKGVGAMTDSVVALDNLKRGISNGWYKAELTTVDGKQAVRLSGKLINGKYYSDVYPITLEVASELRKMGVPTV